MPDRRYLRIYLSERVLLMRGGRDLAARMRGAATEGDLRVLLDEVITELERGSSTLTSFLRQIGAGSPRVRTWFVGLAVRVGQLKLNGRVVERSPLSDLEELDALGVVIFAATAAFTALEDAQVASAEVVRERIDSLAAIATRLEPLRRASAEHVLGQAR